MIDRKRIKESAKRLLQNNYWWMVAIAFIFVTFSGNGNGAVITDTRSSYEDYQEVKKEGLKDTIERYKDELILELSKSTGYSVDEVVQVIEEQRETIISAIIFAFAFAIILSIVTTLALTILLLNPIIIGCVRWFLINRTQKPVFSETGYIFKNGYKNTVRIMFFKTVYQFLWSILLIVPGIIKWYEYRMIPYLLAENPHMDMDEAFARSKELMRGNKLNAFKYDFSFIGWWFASAITLGIVGVLYYYPYKKAADVELYVELCGLYNTGRMN